MPATRNSVTALPTEAPPSPSIPPSAMAGHRGGVGDLPPAVPIGPAVPLPVEPGRTVPAPARRPGLGRAVGRRDPRPGRRALLLLPVRPRTDAPVPDRPRRLAPRRRAA